MADIPPIAGWQFTCDGDMPPSRITYDGGESAVLGYGRVDETSTYTQVTLDPQQRQGETDHHRIVVTYTQTVDCIPDNNTIDLAIAMRSYPLLSLNDNTDVAANLVLTKADGSVVNIPKQHDRTWSLSNYFGEVSSLMSTVKPCLPLIKFEAAKIVYSGDVSSVQLTLESFNVLKSTHPVVSVEINTR